jgi:membrane associated rhomboid family serine protease
MHEPLAPCTIAVLAVTAVVSVLGFRSREFVEKYLFEPHAILADKQYYRMITSGFLHADVTHLVFNAYSFYSFGSLIELVHGARTLLVIYFGAILGGSLLSLYLHRHHDYRALGASGGVCGVIFASIFLLPGGGILLFPIPVPIPAWLYAIVFLIGSFVGVRRQLGRIGHDAHLGGAVIGLLIATAMHPWIVAASPRLYAAVMGISVSLFVYLWLNPQFLPPSSILDRWRERWAESTQRRVESWRKNEQEEIDRLLDKISRQGMHTLTPAERRRLESLSSNRAGSAKDPPQN